MRTPRKPKRVETLTHGKASRKNIPTAEFRSVMERAEQSPVETAYKRRNRDLDPQLVWRGKDLTDWSDLVVQAPPLFIQEKVHPKALIDDLRRQSRRPRNGEAGPGGGGAEVQPDLFADFNGLPDGDARTEFYRHDANWSNRMILGDSLQVMASLVEREGLRGKVQCIYLDPPYGIKFNSNFQWSTTSRDVKDGKSEHITREPEQVKAFRDTWRDGIHSYLTYLRDRLTVARELLTESGSIFVQIGDENVHRVRALMDEVFGNGNFVSAITFKKSSSATERYLSSTSDYIIWYGKRTDCLKYRALKQERTSGGAGGAAYTLLEDFPGHWRSASSDEMDGAVTTLNMRLLRLQTLTSQRSGRDTGPESAMGFTYTFQNCGFAPSRGRGWTTTRAGLDRLAKAERIGRSGRSINYKRYFGDAPVFETYNIWDDTQSGSGMEKIYVVQTNVKVIERCILMATDPGDLVLDPTCGSGTTAYVAEQWGRRWITIDTSRVALALARARVMGARYPYYLLADSPEGRRKEAEVTGQAPSEAPTRGDVRQGFVYQRVPHVTLKSIANNAEIDVIWERWQQTLEPLLDDLNARLDRSWEEWGVPREAGDPWPAPAAAAWERFAAAETDAARNVALQAVNAALDRRYTQADLPTEPRDPWPAEAAETHRLWWEARIARQQEIDASIAARGDHEYLYDRPYEDGRKVRVAGPFTVESLSPHRVLAVDEHDELVGASGASTGKTDSLLKVAEARAEYGPQQDFASMILEQLRTAGVQQADKKDRIAFASVTPWAGEYVCAEGRYLEGGEGDDGAAGDAGREKRAGIFVGPEFGTVSRPDLAAAAREAGEGGFDVLVACAFNYEAHASDFKRLGRLPVLKARMNADLHMADELKNTGKGNLFVVFGEPDIEILPAGERRQAVDEPAYRDERDEQSGDGEEGGDGDRIQVKINGVDVFHPATGEIRSDGAEGIACWFIDTDYDEESFFVRHAYFLGANDPYKALKTTLKAEIDADAWATLHSDVSRPFARPESGRIAVKVINHLGDEVMKVFRV